MNELLSYTLGVAFLNSFSDLLRLSVFASCPTGCWLFDFEHVALPLCLWVPLCKTGVGGNSTAS